jgi:8-oxo-dGTP pyrophosphatase MutT (NUDIX family)
MIAFQQGDKQFMLRCAAILIWDGRVLLQQGKKRGAWVLPGGKIEMLERSADALHRELIEELGVCAEIGKMVAVIENLHAYGAEGLHELGLYYMATIASETPLLKTEGLFAGTDSHLNFEWKPLEQLSNLEIHPSVLKRHLLAIPENIMHLTN